MSLPISAYYLRKYQDELQGAVFAELKRQGVEVALGVTWAGSFTARHATVRLLYGDGIQNIWTHPGVDIQITEIINRNGDGTNRCRLTVKADTAPNQVLRVGFVERTTGDWNMGNVAKAVCYQWAAVKKYTDEMHVRRNNYGLNLEARTRLVNAFGIEKDLHIEPEVVVIATETGLNLDLNVGCTEDEMRLILRTLEGMGLLPGGVRAHQRKKEPKVKDRFQRVG